MQNGRFCGVWMIPKFGSSLVTGGARGMARKTRAAVDTEADAISLNGFEARAMTMHTRATETQFSEWHNTEGPHTRTGSENLESASKKGTTEMSTRQVCETILLQKCPMFDQCAYARMLISFF
jgi:hypothetical protein